MSGILFQLGCRDGARNAQCATLPLPDHDSPRDHAPSDMWKPAFVDRLTAGIDSAALFFDDSITLVASTSASRDHANRVLQQVIFSNAYLEALAPLGTFLTTPKVDPPHAQRANARTRVAHCRRCARS